MLVSESRLHKIDVLSLQTGGKIATTDLPVIDPADLRILAYQVHGPLIHTNPTFIRPSDTRELSDIGLIVDSIDDLVGQGDIIKLDDIYALGFRLDGIHVVDERRKKVGKVVDYTIDVTDFTVQQLIVRRPLFERMTDTELVIHRSQIIEISNTSIVVHSQAKTPEHTKLTTPGSYVNPFRKSKPVAESFDTLKH
jgi:sporulation protein YlmC with PRC-barrel domain